MFSTRQRKQSEELGILQKEHAADPHMGAAGDEPSYPKDSLAADEGAGPPFSAAGEEADSLIPVAGEEAESPHSAPDEEAGSPLWAARPGREDEADAGQHDPQNPLE
jgi:hypothetical protein